MTFEEFIQKAKAIHGDKYDYSKVEYVNTITKVSIVCPVHGEFLQSPRNHFKYEGCPRCRSLSTKKRTQENALKVIDKILADTPYKLVPPFIYLSDRETRLTLRCTLHNLTWEMSWHSFLTHKVNKHFCGCSECMQVYTKTQCHDAALACRTRSEFAEKFPGEYAKAMRSKWLDEVCSHMSVVGNWYYRCIYAYIFEIEQQKFVYVGLTSNLSRRDKEHRNEKDSAVYKFAKKNDIDIPVMQKLTEYLPKEEAALREGELLQKFVLQGYIPLNIVKTGGLGGHLYNDGFTYDTCLEEANKYNSRSEWKQKHYATYYIATLLGWIDSIKPQVARFGNKNQRYWTIERCCKLTKDCSTISEYARKYPVAYAIVCKRKWNDIVFANIERLVAKVNFDLKTIKETLKNYQSTASFAKEHRDMVNWLYHHKIPLRDIATPEQIHRSYIAGTKPIIQCDIEGNVIAEYNSAREAIGYDYKKISACCNGIRKTHKGYKWYFKKDFKKNKNETQT
ncbi:MAG: GIY-YIG nuclease family protein [Paludibacteraceae bacterium]|nr:GIY-YIG nuclease family protein [Paludibacteraceae bacterium]